MKPLEQEQAEPGKGDLNRLGQPFDLADTVEPASGQTDEAILVPAAGMKQKVHAIVATPAGDKPESGNASME